MRSLLSLLLLAAIAAAITAAVASRGGSDRQPCTHGASSVYIDEKGRQHGPFTSGCRP